MNRDSGSRREHEEDDRQESKGQRAEPSHGPDDQTENPVNDIGVNQVQNVRRFS